MTPEDLKKRLEINKAALDEEICQQPMMFQDVAEAYEDAVATRDALKESLATIDAELFRDYKIDDPKATEAMVKSLVQTDKEHKKAFLAWLEAKTIASRWGALKDAFESRGNMLKHLASLYVTGYYEVTSYQGTHATDTALYKERRRVMGEARKAAARVD